MSESPEPQLNAWILRCDDPKSPFRVTAKLTPSLAAGVRDGDGVALYSAKDEENALIGFGRVYRLRSENDAVAFYFDAVLTVTSPRDLTALGLKSSGAVLERIEWSAFAKAFETVAGKGFKDLQPLEGKTIAEQTYIRRLLQIATVDDLLGPANGPLEEVVGMSVRDRYLVGKLAPKDNGIVEGQPTGDESEEESEDGGLQEKANPDHIPNKKKSSYRLAEKSEDEDDSEQAPVLSLVPSSIGFTFCLGGDVPEIEVEARWGRYERRPDLDQYENVERVNKKTGKKEIVTKRHRVWKRIPTAGVRKLKMVEGRADPIVIDKEFPEVHLDCVVRPTLPKGDRLVTIFLRNNQEKPDENQDAAWIFQPEIIVRGLEGAPVFRKRPVLDSDGFDPEREALEMLYRKRVEFAVGHGVSVSAKAVPGQPEKASEVRTVVMPEYEVSVTEPPGSDPGDRPAMQRIAKEGLLDMKKLSALPRKELCDALNVLVEDYAEWIKEQGDRIPGELPEFKTTAEGALSRCETVLKRLREGIAMLQDEADETPLDAFRFANRAMALQRVRSILALRRRRGEKVEFADVDIARNRSWRPFQLAFVLLSIPALSNPKHADRCQPMMAFADLLWFPTGGGKTEAYLGVAAFTMAVRRLQGNLGGYDASRGLAVIMRYTLRLLTIQQFQRAAALLCAMEYLRQETPQSTAKWGAASFTLGLWVGNNVTPGNTEQSHRAIQDFRDGQFVTGATPAQLTSCPWCGSSIKEGRDIDVDLQAGRTKIFCGDALQQCEFSNAKSKHGLPVVVVDSEIYHRPPSMLIGTVDKFAMMAWRGETRTLFGLASQECDRHGLLWADAECSGNHQRTRALPTAKVKHISPLRPPDLVIQDEFHLISGPLGTMVGLYESAIDEMSCWKLDDKVIRPKVIASTATVRKAEEQVRGVFLRKVAVFPPHGVDIEDNFFSVQRPISEKPGRIYLGICSPGSSRPAVLIRVYVALLTASQALFERFGSGADPYMTLVGYFNSLRELGGMRRLAEDDVQTRAFRVAMSRVLRPGLKQRAVRIIEELTSRVSSKQIPQKLDQLELQFKQTWAPGEDRAIDVVLATNMLSVGVDINRLGLMAVNGQPKSTAEYIQATSRVGRAFPGLVCSILTWSRPRDLSHYETFEHYHSTFYKHVEAQSVTPFAPRAMDRGLTGALVSILRLSDETLNPNLGAGELPKIPKSEIDAAKTSITDRAWKIAGVDVKSRAERMIDARVDRWGKEAARPGRKLGYDKVRGQGDVVELLKKPGAQKWDDLTAPMSMREVEPGVTLVMDDAKLTSDGPAWHKAKSKSKGGQE
jgi:hypothetical protein